MGSAQNSKIIDDVSINMVPCPKRKRIGLVPSHLGTAFDTNLYIFFDFLKFQNIHFLKGKNVVKERNCILFVEMKFSNFQNG